MYYLYSNINNYSSITLDDFSKNNFEIRTEHKYEINDRKLDLTKSSSFISFIKDDIKNSKLIIENEDIKIRLLYNLKQALIYKNSYINNYYKLSYVPNYYNNAKDFDIKEHYRVYYTKQEYLYSNLKTYETMYNIYKDNTETIPTSYYYKNDKNEIILNKKI